MSLQDQLQELAGRLVTKAFHDGEKYRDFLKYFDYAVSEFTACRDLLLTREITRKGLTSTLLRYKSAVKRRNALLEGIERECNLPEEYRNERLRGLRRFNEEDEVFCMGLAYDDEGKPIHEKQGEQK